MAQEKLILLENSRIEGYGGTLEEYESRQGFDGFRKALKMEPSEVLEQVKSSGLRGRGGAGFPTGLKWSFMAKRENTPSYLVCNADESEPGTFKDREIMLKDPLLLLEGMMIGCYAVGCEHGYVYIRGEFFPAWKKLVNRIAELKEKKYLGKNIFNSGFNLEITIHQGAGAYICGEETALLDSLEGKRGQPRVKPPFPAVAGFNGCPTSVNNVETLSNLPYILREGGETYSKLGIENNAGTRLICLSGSIRNPGVYEVEMGGNLKDIIEDLGGGMIAGKQMKGVIPGGSSTPVFLPDEINISYDYDSVAKNGSMMGSCGIVVIDDSISIPKFLLRIISFYDHESCGQCTPCREGMNWLKIILRDMIRGNPISNATHHLQRISENIMGNTLCPLGDAGAMPTLAFLKKYKQEFELLAA